jgi:hypothetical protein
MNSADFCNLVHDFLASNRGPGYRVSVSHLSSDLSRAQVTLTFIAGRTYCCAEPFCHLPQDASKFLAFAAERDFSLPRNLQLDWHCVVEEGTLLTSNEALGLPLVSPRLEYDVVSAIPSAAKKTTPPALQSPPP